MVNKDAMFDELSKNFPVGNYANFCNKMGVNYNEAKSMLTRCKENSTEALRDLLAQWDMRKKGVSRDELEQALIDAEVGGLCSIVRRHYEMGSSNTTAASQEVMDHVVNSSGEGVETHSGQGATVRSRDECDGIPERSAPRQDGLVRSNPGRVDAFGAARGSSNTTAASQEVMDHVVNSSGDGMQTPSGQGTIVRPRDECDGIHERSAPRQDGLVRSNLGIVDATGGARGGDPTANIKVERTTETKDGDKATTTFIMTGATKDHMTLFGIGILCTVALGIFIYHRQKN